MVRAAKAVTGARKAPYPGFVEPCHPTLVAQAPSGDRWLHEIKVDGYRCQLHIRDGQVKALTRRGYDWAERFRSVAVAAKALHVQNAIFDGEIVVPGEKELSDFAALQAELATRRGKIFIDYLRNGRGQTAIGTFSPRARVNFPIAAPFSWTEVQRDLPSDDYTMQRLPSL